MQTGAVPVEIVAVTRNYCDLLKNRVEHVGLGHSIKFIQNASMSLMRFSNVMLY